MKKFKKLSDDEAKDLVAANPQAAQIMSSLWSYLTPEKQVGISEIFDGLYCENTNTYERVSQK